MFSDSAKTSEISNPRINDGDSFTCYLGTQGESGYLVDIVWDTDNGINYPLKVMMGENDVTSQSLELVDGDIPKISIQSVTDNVVITAKTSAFDENKALSQTSTSNTNDYVISPYVPIPNSSDKVVLIRSSRTEDWNNRYAQFYKADKTYVNNYAVYPTIRTVPIPQYTGDNEQSVPSELLRTSLVKGDRQKLFILFADSNNTYTYGYRGIAATSVDRFITDYGCKFGYYLTDNGGVETESDTFYCTDYLDVSGYEQLILNIGKNQNYRSIQTYDSSKTRKGKQSQTSTNPLTYTIPAGVHYVRLSTDDKNAYIVGVKTVDGNKVYEFVFQGINVEDSLL
jgi:hypothetical protein